MVAQFLAFSLNHIEIMNDFTFVLFFRSRDVRNFLFVRVCVDVRCSLNNLNAFLFGSHKQKNEKEDCVKATRVGCIEEQTFSK